ncbi:MAG: AmmeMemoRadiSam system radical SAM enzyme [Nanoarchaeota archaeon]|nr:AmmeMemoRadiSam system radical SAM enzyme [Nanoarchaeota archaeon]
MEHEALFYKKLGEKKVHCQLCPHYCVISPDNYGNCRARKNIDGKLYSMVYASPVSVAVDPIEKKPIFHMLPGTDAYSIGTTGCNLHCEYCQNAAISQAFPEDMPGISMQPKEVVENAIREKCPSIAYTYTEPTIFFEYVYDTAILAKKKKLKNIMVTNGFINPEPAKQLYKHIDAAHVDLKGFTEEFYRNICMARLQPVLETLKLLDKMNVWIEIINLIIPGLNDDMKNIKEMCEWIKDNLGTDYPLHFSRFYPCYKMMDRPATPYETLKNAHDVAKKAGLKYVYVGNVPEEEYNHTYCPKCKEILIKRTSFFAAEKNQLKSGKCPKCKTKIEGVWN